MIEFENSSHIQTSCGEIEDYEKTIEQENFTPINKILLLVHPGFCSDIRMTETSIGRQKFQALLGLYLKKAEEVRENPGEIMITYAAQDFTELKDDLRTGNLYGDFFRNLRLSIGRKLIVVSANQDVFEDPDVPKRAIEMAKSRGFQIDRNVDTEVVGECSDVCVLDAGYNFNKSLGLNKKTLLNPALTELPMLDNYDMGRSIESIEREIERQGREQFIEVLK